MDDTCTRTLPAGRTGRRGHRAVDRPARAAARPGGADQALLAAAGEPTRYATERTAWAAARTWDRRTDRWLAAALGDLVAGAPV